MKPLVTTSRGSTTVCDGCRRRAFVLIAVQDARLCEHCLEKSARIDRQLALVRPTDPVSCVVCAALVALEATVAVVIRACGGVVACPRCDRIARMPRAVWQVDEHEKEVSHAES